MHTRANVPTALEPGEAHVWCMALDRVSGAQWPDWYRLLDDTERAAACRFVREVDRQQYVAAHALTRVMLARFAGLAPAHLRFVRGTHGKPAIHPELARPRIQFNLSHTRGVVACAAILDHPIGIDVEDIGRAVPDFDIAERFFAPDEVEQIREAAPEARRDLFFAFWTLKESYIKAIGIGLGQPLDAFAFRLAPIRISFDPAISDDAALWQFHASRPTPESMLAVSLRAAAPVRMQVRAVAPGEIGVWGGSSA